MPFRRGALVWKTRTIPLLILCAGRGMCLLTRQRLDFLGAQDAIKDADFVNAPLKVRRRAIHSLEAFLYPIALRAERPQVSRYRALGLNPRHFPLRIAVHEKLNLSFARPGQGEVMPRVVVHGRSADNGRCTNAAVLPNQPLDPTALHGDVDV